MVKVVGFCRCTGSFLFVFRYIDNTKIDKKQYYATYSTYFFIVLLTGSYHLLDQNQCSKGFQLISPFYGFPKNSVNGHFRGVSGADFYRFPGFSGKKLRILLVLAFPTDHFCHVTRIQASYTAKNKKPLPASAEAFLAKTAAYWYSKRAWLLPSLAVST